jgi:hypothetical protein
MKEFLLTDWHTLLEVVASTHQSLVYALKDRFGIEDLTLQIEIGGDSAAFRVTGRPETLKATKSYFLDFKAPIPQPHYLEEIAGEEVALNYRIFIVTGMETNLKKKLKLFNGRGHGKHTGSSFFVAAYSIKQAAELVSLAAHGHTDMASVYEINAYYSNSGWGNVIKETGEPLGPCLYVKDHVKPARRLL